MLLRRGLRFALTAPSWHWRTVVGKSPHSQIALHSIQAVTTLHPQLLFSNSTRSFATKPRKKGRRRFDREPKENAPPRDEAPIQAASDQQGYGADNGESPASHAIDSSGL